MKMKLKDFDLKESTANWVTRSVEREGKFRDYVEFVQKTVDGQYVYTGPMFSYGAQNTLSWAKYRLVLWISSLLMLAISIFSGTLYVSGMNSFWQAAPLCFEILFGLMTVWSTFRLTFTKQPMKIFDFRPTVGAVPGRAQLTMILAIVGLACMAGYVVFNGFEGKVLSTLLYLLCRLLVAITSALIYKVVDLNDWDEKESSETM